MKKRKHINNKTWIVTGILLVVFLGILLNRLLLIDTSVNQTINSLLSIQKSPREVMLNSSERWFVNNKESYPLKGQSFSNSHLYEEGQIIPINYRVNYYESILYLFLNGFKLDKINSYKERFASTDFIEKSFYKNGVYCSIASDDNDSSLGIDVHVFCGEIDNEAIQLEKQFLEDFMKNDSPLYSKTHQLEDGVVEVISVSGIQGNYAWGWSDFYKNSIPRISGRRWIAAKIDNAWLMIHPGGDSPMCSIMDRYNVPQDIYGDCWLNENERRGD